MNETSIGGIFIRTHTDIGPYVALVTVALGTPYLIWKRQWSLAGYFALTAASIVFRVFLGASDIATALTWLSVFALGVGVYQSFQQRKALTERDGRTVTAHRPSLKRISAGLRFRGPVVRGLGCGLPRTRG